MKILFAGFLAVLCPLIAGCGRAPRVIHLGRDALAVRAEVDLVARAVLKTAMDLSVEERAEGGSTTPLSPHQSEECWEFPEEGKLRRLRTNFVTEDGGEVTVEVFCRCGQDVLLFFRTTSPEPDASGIVLRHFLLQFDGEWGRWR